MELPVAKLSCVFASISPSVASLTVLNSIAEVTDVLFTIWKEESSATVWKAVL